MNTWNDITTPISYSKGPQIKLRSLFDVEDVYYVSIGKKEQNIGIKENVAASTIIDYPDMAIEGYFIAYGVNGQVLQTGIKGDVLADEAAELTYQLAQPIITYFEPDIRDQNGNRIPALIGGPNYTVYFEPDGEWEDTTIPTVVYEISEIQNKGTDTPCIITCTIEEPNDYLELKLGDTGKSITLPQGIAQGDVIIFDTEKRLCTQNGIPRPIDIQSEWFYIPKGNWVIWTEQAGVKIKVKLTERWK